MFEPRSNEYAGKLRWPRLWQDVAIVLWPAFIAANFATLVSFAFIDPVLIGNDDYPPPAFATRMGGYAVGFFFFWLICNVSSLVTLYLVRTAHPELPETDEFQDGARSKE